MDIMVMVILVDCLSRKMAFWKDIKHKYSIVQYTKKMVGLMYVFNHINHLRPLYGQYGEMTLIENEMKYGKRKQIKQGSNRDKKWKRSQISSNGIVDYWGHSTQYQESN